MDIHGDHVRGHGRAAVHVRADTGRSPGVGGRFRAHISPDRVHPGEHRTRPADDPPAGQQHAGQRPTTVADRPGLVPPDEPHRAGHRRGRTATTVVNDTGGTRHRATRVAFRTCIDPGYYRSL